MPFSFAGGKLLQLNSGLSQTFGNTGDRKCGKISKSANAPEPQRFQDLIRNFFLEMDERIIEVRRGETLRDRSALRRVKQKLSLLSASPHESRHPDWRLWPR